MGLREVVEPGALIAILGGGQLGRMTAMAARTMGYRVRVMDPAANCPASFVADEVVVDKWDDVAAARTLALGADVVTLEIEQIDVNVLREVVALSPLRPGIKALRIIQDKTRQKSWMVENGLPTGPFRLAHSALELLDAVAALGGSVFVKVARGGYDGRGQVRLNKDSTQAAILYCWSVLGKQSLLVEKALELDFEISVMAARSPDGEVKCYPASRNHHEDQILEWSTLPAGIDPELENGAQEISRGAIVGLNIEGLLCVEMFVTKSGELLVNELAPRPHNSYHQSERACVTGQFEQLVRAVCNLPLGDTDVLVPTAIVNLLGDLWLERRPNFAAALAVPGVRLHLYEKHEARAGRKMGHLSATGSTAEEALAKALEAKAKL